jgi:putative ATPase
VYALSHLILYLATATKSNSVLKDMNQVKDWIKTTSTQEALFKPPLKLTRKGHKQYKYPHNFEGSFVNESYLPDYVEKLREKTGRAYLPSSYGHEKKFQDRLKSLWEKL